MNARPANVDEYLAALPDGRRDVLQTVRAAIREVAPDAVESIAYGMPAYKHRGKPLTYFGAAKHHWGLYGLVHEAEKTERLAAYEVTKGSIHFPWDQPVPVDLLKDLVGIRLAAIEVAVKAKGSNAGKARA